MSASTQTTVDPNRPHDHQQHSDNKQHPHNNHVDPKDDAFKKVATLVAPPSSVQEGLDWGFPQGFDEEGANNKNNNASKEFNGTHRCRHRRIQLEQGFRPS